MRPTAKPAATVECINPNTGGRMNIAAVTHGLFAKAIYHTLKERGAITFTQMVQGVKEGFRQQKTTFGGSIEWYAVTIKNDMQAKDIIETFTEKGKKLHRLKEK